MPITTEQKTVYKTSDGREHATLVLAQKHEFCERVAAQEKHFDWNTAQRIYEKFEALLEIYNAK